MYHFLVWGYNDINKNGREQNKMKRYRWNKMKCACNMGKVLMCLSLACLVAFGLFYGFNY